MDLNKACCDLTGVGARTDVDLRIGVLEQDPFVVGLELELTPFVPAFMPSSTFAPSLELQALANPCRGVGEALLLVPPPPVAPGGSVRGRLMNPTWLGGGFGW